MRKLRNWWNEQMETGILLFAHGSRVAEANEGVHDLARQIQKAGDFPYVRAAFLEIASPNLAAAIHEAVEAGIRRIIVIPYFLTMGVHLRYDLPRLLTEQKQRYPGLEIHVSESLEGHPLMSRLILDRIQAVCETCKAEP
jgi:sirohydrochlorin ferrochelatase